MRTKGIIAVLFALFVLTAPVGARTFGVAGSFRGSGLSPTIHVPIQLTPSLILEPGIHFRSVENEGSQLDLMGAVEAQLSGSAATPIVGGRLALGIWSPDTGDSRTDVAFGGYFGGSVDLTNNLSLVGQSGLDLRLTGNDGPTIFSTSFVMKVRWWLN
jgi:hypothetical protein